MHQWLYWPFLKLRRRWLVAAAITSCFMLLLAGCGKNAKSEAGSGGGRGGEAAQAVPIAVGKAVVKDVPVQIRDIGSVEAYRTVQVKAQVDGTISGVHFNPGEDVTSGQLLYTIDSRPFEAELRQAEANLAKDAAQAKNDHLAADRAQSLQSKGTVAIEEAQASITKGEVSLAQAMADQAAAESARLKLSYTTITAPLAGRTGDTSLDVGNLVKASGDPLVTIVQIQPVQMTFNVAEQFLPQIRENFAKGKLQVDAVTPGNDRETASGELTFINNEIDKTAGTVMLKAMFPNKQLRLWPGQFVNAILTLSTLKDAVVVPSEAVQVGQQGQYVFVIGPDKKAEMRSVKTGQATRTETVIEQGLKGGETVVTDGHLRLVTGTKVEIQDSPSSGTSDTQQSATPPPGATERDQTDTTATASATSHDEATLTKTPQRRR